MNASSFGSTHATATATAANTIAAMRTALLRRMRFTSHQLWCGGQVGSTILVNTMLTWKEGERDVMQLAMAGQFQKAKNVLKSMDALEDPTGESCCYFGASLESIGDAGAPVEYYEMALL